MKKILGILSLSALLLASCSKSSNPTSSNNNNNTNNTPANTMTVTIDGTSYTFVVLAIKTVNSGQTIINVSGTDTSKANMGKGLGFGLTNIPGPGTYDVGLATINGGTEQVVTMLYIANQSTNYSSPPTPTTSVGKITIQELTATSVKATFDATLAKQKGPGNNSAVVSNGSVNATFM